MTALGFHDYKTSITFFNHALQRREQFCIRRAADGGNFFAGGQHAGSVFFHLKAEFMAALGSPAGAQVKNSLKAGDVPGFDGFGCAVV